MSQKELDRILQLVAYVQSMNYQSKQAMIDGSNYDKMFDALQEARKLCVLVQNSLNQTRAKRRSPTMTFQPLRKYDLSEIVTLSDYRPVYSNDGRLASVVATDGSQYDFLLYPFVTGYSWILVAVDGDLPNSELEAQP